MAKPVKKSKGPRRPQGAPKFDENALEHLTSKIDQNLSNGGDQKRKNPPASESSSRNSKRQRNSSGAPQAGQKVDNELLLAEIKALGGDEKDLDLIKDVDSDDEGIANDKTQGVDKSLKDELLAFSKSLGFAEYQPSEASEEEAEAEQDGLEGSIDGEDQEPEEDEDEDDEEEQDEDEEEEPVKKIGNMTFDPRADWHATKLPKLPGPSSDHAGSYMGAVDSLKIHAKSLLEQDAAKYRTSFFASASHKFLSTIMTSGTLNDKVSALTLAIQESPVHNIRAFDGLFGLASKRSRAQAIGAIGALVDLLGPGTILPPERRLRQFSSQPGLLGTLQRTSTKSWQPGQPYPGKINETHLIYWAYEDWLKETYFKVIQLLENWCSDEIEYSRSRALDFVYGLLKEKPEQEANLLRLLVNKLGDRDRKISSRASYLLLQLQTSHPGMKPVIIRAIEQDVLLHPSQDHRSKYSAVNTLNQTILSSKEPTVAETLMRVYFELFVALLKAGSLGIGNQEESGKSSKKFDGKPPSKSGDKPPGPRGAKKPTAQEVETADKLVSAILTGVNRAAPFVGTNDAIMEKHLDTLFKIAHSSNFNTGIQALLLIQHLSSARSLGTDRFYRTLYESLLDPRLVTSSKQSLYLNLLLRALKNDVDVRRVKAFAKRMLQVASLHQPPFVCGLLYVIAHLKGTFPDLPTLIQEPEESVFDDGSSESRPAYDGRKRDPEHSNAQRSCLWEIIPVQAHYHPSVSVFAAAVVEQDHKVQKPDLESHSLIKFLDKFVYRTPKATDTSRGASLMQPVNATKDVGDIWLGTRTAGASGPAVNSAAFWNKKAEDVAAEDAFFHKYFQHVAKDPKKPTKSKAKDGDDEGDEDAAEDEIWKALVSAQPDVDGGSDGSDMGFDDLDEDEMASDDDDNDDLDLDLDDDDLDAEMDDLDDDDEVDIEGSDEDGLVAIEEDDEGITVKDAASEAKDKRKSRRKQLKDLPMFASVDDYAELLAQEEEDF